MVEHTVQHHTDAVVVEGAANLGEVLIGAQAGVYSAVVPSVITMAVAVEQRREVDCIGPQLLDMLCPVPDFADAVGLNTIVNPRRTAEAQGINLIKNAFLRPHMDAPLAHLGCGQRLWTDITAINIILYLITFGKRKKRIALGWEQIRQEVGN